MPDSVGKSVQLFSVDEIAADLNFLENLLCGLPDDLPCGEQFYRFQSYTPSEEDKDTYGAEGAVNHDLEVIFCPGGRQAGPIILKERGPGLTAVVTTLRWYIQEFPQSVILQKWVFDLTDSAIKHGATASRKGPAIDPVLAAPLAEWHNPDQTNDSPSDVELVASEGATGKAPQAKEAAPKPKKKKKKTAHGSASVMDLYEDLHVPQAKAPGGRKGAKILDDLSVYTRLKDDPVPSRRYYRCIGAEKGCDTRWILPRNKSRVLNHANTCSHVDPKDRQRAGNELSQESMGAALERKQQAQLPTGDSRSQTQAPTSTSGTQSPSSSSTFASSSSSNSSSSSSRTTTPSAPSVSGSKFKPLPQPSLYTLGKKAARDDLKLKLDHCIMRFFVVGGIPPSKVDMLEWKEMWSIGNRDYTPVSSTTMEDVQIPREAAFVNSLVLKHLQASHNLTMTFDGGTTKGLESIYTIHVTTPDRRVFLFEGSEASDQSHTSAHLHGVLKAAMETIGPHRFQAIGSDNTGNTSGARVAIKNDYPWIMILPDPCHRLSLLAKDICKIDYFHPTINNLRATIRYFKKSSFAGAHLRKARRRLKIGRGLVSVGKTRFVTVYFSGESLRRNLPAIQQLCREEIVKIKNVNHLFMSGYASSEFAMKLDQLLTVLAPIGKATTCLESTHSTVSDVFIFWLAIMAELHEFITSPINSLDFRVKEKIRRAANYRYQEMFATNDVYLTGFVLDPRYRNQDILRELNPLAIKAINLRPKSRPTSSNDQAAEPESLRKVGQYLLSALRVEYEHKKHKIADLEPADAVPKLKQQIREFVKGAWPFDRPVKPNDGPREWWERLNICEEAQPLAQLACNIFAIVPNSMADERTASTFTWLNSHLRARQKAATLVRMTQIRQWYKHDPNKSVKKLVPTVKFRDISKLLSAEATASRKRKRDEGEGEGEGNVIGADEDTSEDEDEDDLDDGWEQDDQDGCGNAVTDHLIAEDDANLSSPLLRDILAESPVVVSQAATQGSEPSLDVVIPPKRVLGDADWQF